MAYNRFRYYSPQMGMYVSQDPIRLNASILNLFTYVTDVNSFIDLFGLAKSAYTKKSGPLHHIATNKNTKRGKKWTNKYKPFFDNAGLSMDCPENKVYVPGHKGPHPDEYHQYVYDKIDQATSGIDPDTDKDNYKAALISALEDVATEAQTEGTNVNIWLTKVKIL